MSNLIPVEFKNQRIITTKVLAEEFGTKEDNIKTNFNNNKARFKEGKHYFQLKGEELKTFKRGVNDINDPSIKFASVLTLWTEKGAARHAKILDTDEAWDVYEELEETYFRVKEGQPKQLSAVEELRMHYNAIEEQEGRINKLETGLGNVNKKFDELPLFTADAKALKKLVNRIVVPLLGGKKSNAYKPLSKKVFSDLYGQVHREFGVDCCDAIKRKDLEFAREFISEYRLPTALKNEIDILNNQSKLDV